MKCGWVVQMYIREANVYIYINEKKINFLAITNTAANYIMIRRFARYFNIFNIETWSTSVHTRLPSCGRAWQNSNSFYRFLHNNVACGSFSHSFSLYGDLRSFIVEYALTIGQGPLFPRPVTFRRWIFYPSGFIEGP